MKSIEIDVLLNQHSDTTAARTDDSRILATPEITVMHENRVCAAFRCGSEKIYRSSDAGNNAVDIGRPFHLQPVWAIISKRRDVEISFEVGVELCALHRVRVRSCTKI